MLSSEYMELNISDVELDYENPRIAKYIEMYGKDKITKHKQYIKKNSKNTIYCIGQ